MSLSDTARPFFSKHFPEVFIPSAMVTLREIEITGRNGRLVSRTTQTQSVIIPK